MICRRCRDDKHVVLSTQMKSFLWECTACGWFKRVLRESYYEETNQQMPEVESDDET